MSEERKRYYNPMIDPTVQVDNAAGHARLEQLAAFLVDLVERAPTDGATLRLSGRAVGIIDESYVEASFARGQTLLRPPGVAKGTAVVVEPDADF